MAVRDAQTIVGTDAGDELGLPTVTGVSDLLGRHSQILERQVSVTADGKDLVRGQQMNEPEHYMAARQSFAAGMAAI